MPPVREPITRGKVKPVKKPIPRPVGVLAPATKWDSKKGKIVGRAPGKGNIFKPITSERPDKGLAPTVSRKVVKKSDGGILGTVKKVAAVGLHALGNAAGEAAKHAAPPGTDVAVKTLTSKPARKVVAGTLKQFDKGKVGGTAFGLATASAPTGVGTKVATVKPGESLPGNVVNRWRNAAIVAAEDPKVLKRLPGDAAKALAQSPAGLYGAATHPKDTAKNAAHDYGHRYGGKLSDAEQRKEMKEKGILPEALDVGTVVTAGVGGTSRVLQKAAEAGKLGERAERVATVRPKLMVGGEAHPQPVSRSFVRNVVSAKHDKARARRMDKHVSAARKEQLANPEHAPGVHPEVDAAKRVSAVTPLTTTSKHHIGQKFAGRRVRKVYAQAHARAQQEGRLDVAVEDAAQRDLLQGSERAKRKGTTDRGLTKDEAKGFYYVNKYGLRHPKQARAILRGEIKRIHAARKNEPERFNALDVGKTDAVAEMQAILHEPEKFLTPRVFEVQRIHAPRAKRLAELDPTIDTMQAKARAIEPQARAVGVVRKRDAKGNSTESDAEFYYRARRVVKKKGLGGAGYVPSKIVDRQKFLPFTIGRGKHARSADKRYTGAADKFGLASSDTAAVIRSQVKHVSRARNWQMVADIYDRLAYKQYKGHSLRKQVDDATRDGLDLGKVVFVNPGVIRREMHEASLSGDLNPADDLQWGAGSKALGERLKKSEGRIDLSEFSPAERARILDTVGHDKDYVMIPKELDSQFTGFGSTSGKAGRSFDIAKTKASRVLLANPAWLQFQIGANALLTGLSGTGPLSITRSVRWWNSLTEAEKRAVEPYIGAHRWYDQQPHLGSAGGNLTQAWNALKTTDFWRNYVHKANPLDAIFKVDNAQNNFFRRAVFYNRARREAYARMGESTGRILHAQDRLAHLFEIDPNDRIKALIADKHTVENLAKDVNDFLGDYMSYTPAERAGFGRFVMFYGFMRFALKFTFYTMPIHHPLMSQILLNLGRLQRDELEKIFGGDVPPWHAADYYHNGDKVAISRMSPYFPLQDYVAQSEEAKGLKLNSLIGYLPPVAQEAINQITTSQASIGKNWKLGGSTQESKGWAGISDRLKVAVADLSNVYLPGYRQVAQGAVPGVNKLIEPNYGKQGADSSLFFREPTVYKGVDKNGKKSGPSLKRKAENADIAAEQRKAVESGEKFKALVGPLFFPEPSAADIKKQQAYSAKRKKVKKKAATGGSIGAVGSGSLGGSIGSFGP